MIDLDGNISAPNRADTARAHRTVSADDRKFEKEYEFAERVRARHESEKRRTPPQREDTSSRTGGQHPRSHTREESRGSKIKKAIRVAASGGVPIAVWIGGGVVVIGGVAYLTWKLGIWDLLKSTSGLNKGLGDATNAIGGALSDAAGTVGGVSKLATSTVGNATNTATDVLEYINYLNPIEWINLMTELAHSTESRVASDTRRREDRGIGVVGSSVPKAHNLDYWPHTMCLTFKNEALNIKAWTGNKDVDSFDAATLKPQIFEWNGKIVTVPGWSNSTFLAFFPTWVMQSMPMTSPHRLDLTGIDVRTVLHGFTAMDRLPPPLAIMQNGDSTISFVFSLDKKDKDVASTVSAIAALQPDPLVLGGAQTPAQKLYTRLVANGLVALSAESWQRTWGIY